ncbi:MAG TPA: rubredoxin [Victivallales bacterium]|nr:rubredoxin [Victivallales bacterium]
MKCYICKFCGYEYDPVEGDPINKISIKTTFKNLPNDWKCPICQAVKADFYESD